VSFKRKKVVIGNYGIVREKIDGQTIKTRLIADSLESVYPADVIRIDIGGGVKAKALALMAFFVSLFRAKEVFVLPGINFLRFGCLPLIFLCRLFKSDVHYVVVGGWIKQEARSPFIGFLLARFDSVNLELKSLVIELFRYNKATYWLPNFRDTDFVPSNPLASSNESCFKLVYFSRVMREKGIFEAIEVASGLLASGWRCQLTIYGPLDFVCDEDLTLFKNKLSSNIKYKGLLQPNSMFYEELSLGDIMLFPSTYPGEGFPGAIVDTFIAGLPVIASNWAYNSEIVINGRNGFIVDSPFAASAVRVLQDIISSKEIMKNARREARESSFLYRRPAFLAWLEALKVA
jgi:glycosyltransferase involved in cell wall biosynthesis